MDLWNWINRQFQQQPVQGLLANGGAGEFTVDGQNFPANETVKVDLTAGAVEDPIWGTSLIVSLLPYCPAA